MTVTGNILQICYCSYRMTIVICHTSLLASVVQLVRRFETLVFKVSSHFGKEFWHLTFWFTYYFSSDQISRWGLLSLRWGRSLSTICSAGTAEVARLWHRSYHWWVIHRGWGGCYQGSGCGYNYHPASCRLIITVKFFWRTNKWWAR